MNYSNTQGNEISGQLTLKRDGSQVKNNIHENQKQTHQTLILTSYIMESNTKCNKTPWSS